MMVPSALCLIGDQVMNINEPPKGESRTRIMSLVWGSGMYTCGMALYFLFAHIFPLLTAPVTVVLKFFLSESAMSHQHSCVLSSLALVFEQRWVRNLECVCTWSRYHICLGSPTLPVKLLNTSPLGLSSQLTVTVIGFMADSTIIWSHDLRSCTGLRFFSLL